MVAMVLSDPFLLFMLILYVIAQTRKIPSHELVDRQKILIQDADLLHAVTDDADLSTDRNCERHSVKSPAHQQLLFYIWT